MRNVSKEIFLNTLLCPTLGWLMRSGELKKKTADLTLGEKFRIEEGIEIGKRARGVFSGGHLVDDRRVVSAAENTQKLVNDPDISTIFEATFMKDGLIAKADILQRQGEGWKMIEVKSSVNDKPEFIDDMAYTKMVMDRCGFDVSNVSLYLISKDFRLGMECGHFFSEIDHTDGVHDRFEALKPLWSYIEDITKSTDKPDSELRFECRKCQIFNECLGQGIENHIFDIPRLSQKKFSELVEMGVTCIEHIPAGFALTENQAKVRECVKEKKTFIGENLSKELRSIKWPAYYLDFETVMTALPLYPNTASYEQLPTQYSIHKCSEPGNIIGHNEYLADPSRDCRKELAKSLIKDSEGYGSIIVYSNFEKTIINKLAKSYPELSVQFSTLLNRLVDLVVILQKNFYHPDFHGSTSIKRTLPVLVPGMSYEGMEIAEGDTAMASFAYLALGRYADKEAERVKKNLLAYCEQDTLAMVRLHQHLAQY